MKKLLLKTFLTIGTGLMVSVNASAQDQSAVFLKAGIDNANNFANAYLGPLMKGFGVGLNDGWNLNTAKPLGTGGFDLRFNIGGFMVPTADQTYNLSDVFKSTSTSNIQMVKQPGTPDQLPTLFGSKDQPAGGIDVNATIHIAPGIDSTKTLTKMQLPPGMGVPYMISLPSAQLSFGTYKNTEINIRFIPTMAAGDFKVGSWGFGVKHDIKQWIPVIKDQKIWDLSAFFTYTSFNMEFGFGAHGLMPDSNAVNPYGNTVDWTNQKMMMTGSGFSLGALVSAKLLFITPYVGLNFAHSSFDMKFAGNYAIPVANDNPTTADLAAGRYSKVSKVVDPIDIAGTVNTMRACIGLRMKLLILVIGGEYSIGTYNTVTFSLGLNLQSIVPFKL